MAGAVMMGRDHVLIGVAGGLAVGAVAHVPIVTAVAGAVVCGGAALLPDFDHPHSTLAHSLGWPTRVLAKGVARATGGHRHATHSFLFAAAMGALTYLTVVTWGWRASAAVAFLCTAVAVKMLTGRGHPLTVAAIAAGAAWWLGHVIADQAALCAVLVAAGCVLHLVADSVTRGGFPWLWPLPWRWSADLVTTGSTGETAIVGAVVCGTGWLLWSVYLNA